MAVLVYAKHDNSTLNDATAKAVTAAAGLGGEIHVLVAGEDAGQDAHDAIHYQGEYVKELIAETDYPSFDVDGANEAFFEWKKHKKKGIMEFRNHSYRSVITGTMAPPHHTPWKDALDDSLESYLGAAKTPAAAE